MQSADSAAVAAIAAGIAALIALAALIVSIVSASYTRGQRDATGRQADAAEAQVELMRRQVDLMERQAVNAGETVRAVPYVSPWVVQHFRGSIYTLVNAGDDAEFEVAVELPENVITRPPLSWESIGAREAETFFASPTWGADRKLTVTWVHESGGERQSWTGVLPKP